MSFDLDIWRADSSSKYLGHVRSRPQVKVHDHRRKKVVKAVGATSNEGLSSLIT